MSNFLPAESVTRFRHQAVRDLAWSCLSPPLMIDLPGAPAWQNPDTDGDLDWLTGLDQAPDALLKHLAQRPSQRLGLYFEQLWRFYWLHHPDARLIAHNLQVLNPATGQTLGAFDFLLNWRGDFWHMETAVKFYLGLPAQPGREESEWQDWRGPGAEDRLDLKLQRLLTYQLPLSRDPVALAQIPCPAPQNPWQPRLRLAGYLFYPYASAMKPPPKAHPHHLRGQWCYWHESQTLFMSRPDSRWLPLERHQWLSPAFCDQQEKLLQAREFLQAGELLRQRLGEQQRPILVARMAAGPRGWWETERLFVVPDNWPAQTSAPAPGAPHATHSYR